jgi:hypothetical protein
MPSIRPQPLSACFLLVCAGAVAGCGCSSQPDHQALPPEKSQIQRDIDKTEAASAAGYDGGALKHDVQGMVDRQDRQDTRTQSALDAASGNEPAPVTEPEP